MKRIGSFVFSFVAISAALAPAALADKIYLRNGRVIEGKVVQEDNDHVQVELRMGSATYDRDQIDHIEKTKSPEEQFADDFLKAKTAAEFVTLGQKAKKDGLDKQAARAFDKAISLDKDNKDAHEGRGDHLENGRWYTAKEWEASPEFKAQREQEAKDKQKKDADATQGNYGKELEGVGWGDAFVIPTKHYVIKCNSTKEIAQRYADFMEKIRAAYDKVFSNYKHYWDKPSNIYIFRNNTEFREYMSVPEGVGGYYRPVSENTDAYPDRVVSAYHGRFGATGDTRLVLAHECTHQMEHILCQGDGDQFLQRPPWWAEGFAVYFGDGFKLDKKGNLTVGIPRDRLSILQQVVKMGVVPDKLKISQFVRWDIGMYQQNAGIAYPFGWSLVYYFLHRGEDAKGVNHPVKIGGKDIDLQKALDKFFQCVTEAPPKDKNPGELPDYYGDKLNACLGVDVDEITEDWKKYVMDLQLPKLGKVKGDEFTSEDAAFKVSKPKAWKWNENDVQGEEAIWMTNDATSGWVRISVDGNMNNQTLDDVVDQTEKSLDQELAVEGAPEHNPTTVNGFDGMEMVYRGTPIDAHEGALPSAMQRSGKQYVRRILIVTLKRSYHIICQCDDGKEGDNKAFFDQVIQSFNVLKDKEN